MITLSLLPCGDTKDCAESKTTVAISSNGGHHDHEEDTENCSPFCICACCSVQMAIHTDESLLQPLAVNECEYVSHTIPSLQEQNKAIWQPPKIG